MKNKIPFEALKNCREYNEKGKHILKCEIKKFVRVYQDGTVRDFKGEVVDHV